MIVLKTGKFDNMSFGLFLLSLLVTAIDVLSFSRLWQIVFCSEKVGLMSQLGNAEKISTCIWPTGPFPSKAHVVGTRTRGGVFPADGFTERRATSRFGIGSLKAELRHFTASHIWCLLKRLLIFLFFFFTRILFLGKTNEFKPVSTTSLFKADQASPAQWPSSLWDSFFSNVGQAFSDFSEILPFLLCRPLPHRPTCLRMIFPGLTIWKTNIACGMLDLVGYFKIKLMKLRPRFQRFKK